MEIRQVRKEEIQQAIELADRTFRDEGHTSMGTSFPHVFSKQMELSFGAFDDGKLVSFIGLVPSKIILGDAALDVFSIGAVCTDEGYQKRGISTSILREVYAFIDKSRASLLFISGDRGLYRRNDCYHFGAVSTYTLSEQVAGYGGHIRGWRKSDLFLIDRIRRKTTVRYESTPWEWSNLVVSGGYASILKMEQEVLVAERDGEVEAYAVFGFPAKNSIHTHGVVTDWGGNPQGICGILSGTLGMKGIDRVEISVPFHDSLHHQLAGHQAKKTGNGGTIYIIDHTRLIEQVKPYLLAEGFTEQTVKALERKLDMMTPEERVAYLFGSGEKENGLPIPLPSTTGLWYV